MPDKSFVNGDGPGSDGAPGPLMLGNTGQPLNDPSTHWFYAF